MTETWSIFSHSDILLALFGGAGLVSVLIVMTSALGNVDRRERQIRTAIEEVKKQLEDAPEDEK
jgi:hypothetical protein